MLFTLLQLCLKLQSLYKSQIMKRHCQGGVSLPQADVVTLKAALKRTSRSKQPGSAGVVAVGVDGRDVLLGLVLVHVLLVSLHPSS